MSERYTTIGHVAHLVVQDVEEGLEQEKYYPQFKTSVEGERFYLGQGIFHGQHGHSQ